eukprot:GHVT01100864.1.p1 GENE.GHVT01100864.1~~GHVT01100864.1.p1  ORF type:complete len:179 (-),score=23.82 GHVT01100864.1:219-755(-)
MAHHRASLRWADMLSSETVSRPALSPARGLLSSADGQGPCRDSSIFDLDNSQGGLNLLFLRATTLSSRAPSSAGHCGGVPSNNSNGSSGRSSLADASRRTNGSSNSSTAISSSRPSSRLEDVAERDAVESTSRRNVEGDVGVRRGEGVAGRMAASRMKRSTISPSERNNPCNDNNRFV